MMGQSQSKGRLPLQLCSTSLPPLSLLTFLALPSRGHSEYLVKNALVGLDDDLCPRAASFRKVCL